MRAYQFTEFGLNHLRPVDVPEPVCGPAEIVLDVRAASLNYRDLLVIRGHYNPKLRLPATPLSDGAGVVSAVGSQVRGLRVGDRVVTQFVVGWQAGRFRDEYLRTTLGTPGPGLATERVVLPEPALAPIPSDLTFASAATLPIAALTAWSALVTEGRVEAGQTVLTLGTGGVSIFALQIATALGAQVIVTSGSDAKLERARELGASHVINYRTQPDWEKQVLAHTGGVGVDVVVETGGAGTFERSVRATRAGGTIALLGALTGLKAEINLGPLLMRRIRVAGIMVDSRAAFVELLRFVERHRIAPVIDRAFGFDELRAALEYMERGEHFGKIVLQR